MIAQILPAAHVINRSESLSIDSGCTIYLTIDDGPSASSAAINMLALKDSAFLTTFIVGKIARSSELMQQRFFTYCSNPFIEVCNHSYCHANNHYKLFYKNPQVVVSDILSNADTLQLNNKIVRLPGRNTWRIYERKRTDLPDASSAADILSEKGYKIFGWDMEWTFKNDSCNTIQPATDIISAIENCLLKKESFTPFNIIILCHENMFGSSENLQQLEILLTLIKLKKGWSLSALRSYPDYKQKLKE